jgi:glutathione peroxidase-family protein
MKKIDSKTENNIDYWSLLAGNKEQATGKEVVEEASEMEKKKNAVEEILEVASNSKAEKKTDDLSFMVEEHQVTGKEIVQVPSETTESKSETDGSDVGEEDELMTDEEFEQVFAEVNKLLAYTTRYDSWT